MHRLEFSLAAQSFNEVLLLLDVDFPDRSLLGCPFRSIEAEKLHNDDRDHQAHHGDDREREHHAVTHACRLHRCWLALFGLEVTGNTKDAQEEPVLLHRLELDEDPDDAEEQEDLAGLRTHGR